jgi:hypothetical protein
MTLQGNIYITYKIELKTRELVRLVNSVKIIQNHDFTIDFTSLKNYKYSSNQLTFLLNQTKKTLAQRALSLKPPDTTISLSKHPFFFFFLTLSPSPYSMFLVSWNSC